MFRPAQYERIRYIEIAPVGVGWIVGEATVDNAGLDILDQARRFDADLIVVGAYDHSRLGGWAFGGVTEELPAQSNHFFLPSHWRRSAKPARPA